MAGRGIIRLRGRVGRLAKGQEAGTGSRGGVMAGRGMRIGGCRCSGRLVMAGTGSRDWQQGGRHGRWVHKAWGLEGTVGAAGEGPCMTYGRWCTRSEG
jgi:hypothetical protein